MARQDEGKVLVTFNAEAGPAAPGDEQQEVELEGGPTDWRLDESRMWERLDERAKRLDGQVAALELERKNDDRAEQLMRYHQDPTTASPECQSRQVATLEDELDAQIKEAQIHAQLKEQTMKRSGRDREVRPL